MLTTLNFTSFAASGPLPSTHIPSNLSFRASSISPFSANLHSQIVSCGNDNGNGDEDLRVRWILNDGVVPLDGVRGCGRDKDGWCPLDTFVTSTRDNLRSIDWAHDCCEYLVVRAGPCVCVCFALCFSCHSSMYIPLARSLRLALVKPRQQLARTRPAGRPVTQPRARIYAQALDGVYRLCTHAAGSSERANSLFRGTCLLSKRDDEKKRATWLTFFA